MLNLKKMYNIAIKAHGRDPRPHSDRRFIADKHSQATRPFLFTAYLLYM